MSAVARIRRRRDAGGSVAIELAFIITLTFFIIPVILLFGRAIWYYSALKQATHDAARFMASVPVAEMMVLEREQLAEAQATQMVRRALADAGLSASERGVVAILCVHPEHGVATCAETTQSKVKPLSVTVRAYVDVDVDFYGEMMQEYLGNQGDLIFNAATSVPYSN